MTGLAKALGHVTILSKVPRHFHALSRSSTNLVCISEQSLSDHLQDAEDVVTDGRTTEICTAAGTPRRFVFIIIVIVHSIITVSGMSCDFCSSEAALAQ